VLKKATRNKGAVDVPADDPAHTMERFTDGLRRVLTAPKRVKRAKKRKRIT
jgi:hypothetical protein